MAPKIDPGTLGFALGARFLARSTPKRPGALLGASGGRKKTLDAPKGAPSEFPSHFCPLPFLENRCWRLGGVQKSRVQGLRGHSPGLGGEAKASPTTGFACCLKLRFAKLEAPLRGAMRDLTTAKQVGRRILNVKRCTLKRISIRINKRIC